MCCPPGQAPGSSTAALAQNDRSPPTASAKFQDLITENYILMVSKWVLKPSCSCQLHETVSEGRKGHLLCGFQQVKYGWCVFMGGCVKAHTYTYLEKNGVQGMIARLMSFKSVKVSCHHQHWYYLLTQTAIILQLCP